MAEGGNGCCATDAAASTNVSDAPPLRCSTAATHEDAGVGDAASPEGASALLALDVNLAHNELRAMLEAVYDEMDGLQRRSQELQEENKRLREETDRRQDEFASAVDERGAEVTRLQRELLDVKQQHQDLSTRHEAQEAERARLEAVVKARDKTIAELKKLLEETMDKRKAGVPVGSTLPISEDELKRAVDNFSRREQQVYGNMDYVRKASGGLQAMMSELATHISELRREMARLQQQHAEYKAHIDNHRCDAESTNRIGKDAVTSQVVAVESNENNGVKHRVASLELERDALKLRCQSLDADIKVIQKQLADATRINAASQDLIAKYEESARDGTQTIDGLQESLLAVCAQLEEERERHRRASQEAASLSADKARAMQAEITRLQDQISSMDASKCGDETTLEIEIARSDLRAAIDAERARTGVTSTAVDKCASQTRRSSLQLAPASHNTVRGSPTPSARAGATVLVDGSSLQPPRPSLQHAPSASSKRPRSQHVEEIDDSDIGEGILTTIAEAARKNVASKSSGGSKRAPPLDLKAPCAGCRGEPFGFMVRCHKCKGQFHISCTQSAKEATKGKRKMRHVFQCVKCTSALQQRPSKVPRKSNTTSAA